MKIQGILALLALALVAGALHADDKVEITPVKLGELKAAIAKHKGKIVVVDFWATFCIPCRKEFPNLVALHGEQSSTVSCISVTVDDPDDTAKALRFLKQQKATFDNYLLDEKAEVYQKEFGFAAVPCVLVYGKDGKLVKKFSDKEFTYKDVRKVVDKIR
jgi:thiol-disulfide isomerase/thioredoxin